MRDVLATGLCLAIIVGTVWGTIALCAFGVGKISAMGIPAAALYFLAGIITGIYYKKIGGAFMNFCSVVFERIHEWLVWK